MRYKITQAEVSSTESINSEARIELIRAQWQKLMETYILLCGSQALNLPSPTRDRLLAVPITAISIYPSELDDTIAMVYEMISQSVLVPSLESAILSNERRATTASSVPDEGTAFQHAWQERESCVRSYQRLTTGSTTSVKCTGLLHQAIAAYKNGRNKLRRRFVIRQEQRRRIVVSPELALVTRTPLIGTRRTNVRSGISPTLVHSGGPDHNTGVSKWNHT